MCVLSDHRKGRLRLLSNCGVPARHVWLSRQTVLLALAALTLPVFLVFAIFLAPETYSPERAEYVRQTADACVFVFCYVIVAITAGQFCAMFMASVILAAIFSMLLTFVLAVWWR